MIHASWMYGDYISPNIARMFYRIYFVCAIVYCDCGLCLDGLVCPATEVAGTGCGLVCPATEVADTGCGLVCPATEVADTGCGG
jgi:hypothetical protein